TTERKRRRDERNALDFVERQDVIAQQDGWNLSDRFARKNRTMRRTHVGSLKILLDDLRDLLLRQETQADDELEEGFVFFILLRKHFFELLSRQIPLLEKIQAERLAPFVGKGVRAIERMRQFPVRNEQHAVRLRQMLV